jgi:hypothetical protein
VGIEQMTKMLLAEDDDVIKIISPDRSWTRSAARETAESRRDDCPLRGRQRDRGIGRGSSLVVASAAAALPRPL